MKWAGGKRGSIDALARLLPAPHRIAGYRSPCIGGAADFLLLYRKVRPAVLSDTNAELITLYRVAQRAPDALRVEVERLRTMFLAATSWEAFDAIYYALRDAKRFAPGGDATDVEVAARMIALNKTCHNGIFRQNRRGAFNVPPGRKVGRSKLGAAPVQVREFLCTVNLHRVHEALVDVDLVVSDLVPMIETAARGELVYLDPPYWPAQKGGFTGYMGAGFSADDQRRLAEAARAAAARGVHIAISNHDLPATRELYRGFHIAPLLVHHQVNRNADARGKVPEILACSFEPGSLT